MGKVSSVQRSSSRRNSSMIVLVCLATVMNWLVPIAGHAQNPEKVFFNPADSTSGYYLAVRPWSGQIKAVMVLLRGFAPPESIIPETNLANVAAANGILTIMASANQKLVADDEAVDRLNGILTDVVRRFKADTSKFALGGYDIAGTIVLRYTELAWSGKGDIPLKPRAVFTIASPVDVFRYWQRNEAQIRKNFFAGSVDEGKFIIGRLTTAYGDVKTNRQRYEALSPADFSNEEPGNERFLLNASVRVYFDTDIAWQLANRRNSYDDTNIPDGAELIKRLLLQGSQRAEFVSGRPGIRADGSRNPTSFSIVEEAACVNWLKESLGLFDPNSWKAPYKFGRPEKWSTELFSLPPDFASGIPYEGVEDVRFAPGWGDSRTDEYWSYAFVWLINGNPFIDAPGLSNCLRQYYDGLISRNISIRKIPASKVFPAQVTIRKTETDAGDLQTFRGEINMLDYLGQQPMVMHCTIHQKKTGIRDKTVLLFEVSPQAAGKQVWKVLDGLNAGFDWKE